MVEKVRQERERVMQQNQQERRERKNQIPKRKKGKLPSDFTSPSEETMLHKGKQKHRAEVQSPRSYGGRSFRRSTVFLQQLQHVIPGGNVEGLPSYCKGSLGLIQTLMAEMPKDTSTSGVKEPPIFPARSNS
ncbi:hypothetical protein F7725_005165 [Dissostichus mawsoni]|uniref:Uncharacterized protein n=1 Tax=Dissostichus mawsoni TaxID=36200 RepID=A0A7J5YQX5_DISMA|nr:hypothetical protein F7725_005165 [Dissostichus mawsoni]